MNNELAGYFLYNEEYKEWEETHAGTPNSVPLYTHPVKELTLTEDEIDDVWAACSTGESDTIDMHLFAEAILKKAQEKWTMGEIGKQAGYIHSHKKLRVQK